jgi:4-amino-4-deoxy-L-arabinose transferase-like glycosyltransferase
VRRLTSAGTAGIGALAALAAWFAVTAWARPLMLPDEGRYAGVAWEMLRSGDWLTPTLDGLPFFHKPPLFYWLTAASLGVFGVNDWAARLASVAAATGAAYALYRFTWRWEGHRIAVAAVAVLATHPLFFVGAQFANLDMLVAGCISVTILLLAHAAHCVNAGLPYRRTLAAAWVFAALGVLAKGLIGFVLPALVIGSWLLLSGHWCLLPRLLWVPAIALFMLVAGPWFAAMQARFPEFGHYFFVVQHFQRYAGGGFNNVQPLWFFPAVLGLLSLPWVGWGLRLPRRHSAPELSTPQLMWLWLLVVVVFFSLPQSKLLGYVLPAVPPLAYLIGARLARPGETGTRRRWLLVTAAVAVALDLGTVAGLAWQQPGNSRNIATALAHARAPGQPVLFLHEYFYDIPLYARLEAPVAVVDDWANPQLRQRDNWRKELADAGDFAPGTARLVQTGAFGAALCASPVSWVVGGARDASRYDFLAQENQVAREGDLVLWRVETGARPNRLACPGMPTGDSPRK